MRPPSSCLHTRLQRGSDQTYQHPGNTLNSLSDNTNPLVSLQINLKSCCVVPEELSVFAKEKAITLYTHSDPSELLPGDCLR